MYIGKIIDTLLFAWLVGIMSVNLSFDLSAMGGNPVPVWHYYWNLSVKLNPFCSAFLIPLAFLIIGLRLVIRLWRRPTSLNALGELACFGSILGVFYGIVVRHTERGITKNPADSLEDWKTVGYSHIAMTTMLMASIYFSLMDSYNAAILRARAILEETKTK